MKKLFTVLSIMLLGASPANSQFSFYAGSVEGCAPMYVDFYNTSSSGVHFDWNFGDGGFSTDTYNASYTYLTPGVYNVSMDAFDASYVYIGNHSKRQ